MQHPKSKASTEVTRKRSLSTRLAPWMLLAPAIIMVMVALGYPLVRQFILSFQEFGLAQQFGKPAKWVLFDNYLHILRDPYFWTVFLKSIVFCLWTATISLFIGLMLAILMLRVSKVVRTFLNTTLVVVWAMPGLAALTVWQWLVETRAGLLNYVLTIVGLKGFYHFNWLGHNFWTFYLIASVIIIWASIPLITITIYAALAQVPGDVIEAAQIDGTNWRQQITKIMLPMIAPVVALISVLQIIWDLRVFTQIYVLQRSGGLTSQTNLLGTYVYQVGISQGNYGRASALAMIILVLTLVLTSRYLWMLYRQGKVE